MNRKTCINDGWQSIFSPDPESARPLAVAVDEWVDVSVPHNWQDYHGYRNISHGDLHGRARYRRTIPAVDSGLLCEGGRVMLQFDGVSSTAQVFVNGVECGSHTGTFTGFRIDVTQAWKVDEDNLLEVAVVHDVKMTDQPFMCGGCEGAPYAEGAQPLGIFRDVFVLKTGAVRFQPYGLYAWTDKIAENAADIRMKYECENPSEKAQQAELRLRLCAPDGVEVFEATEQVSLAPGERVSRDLPVFVLDEPLLWSPQTPYCYQLEARLQGEDGFCMDELSAPLGVRVYQWPKIAKPDAQHEVCSARVDRKLLSDGLAAPSEENNAHTRVLKRSSERGVASAPCGLIIKGDFNADEATIRPELTLAGSSAGAVLLEAEVTNVVGTVFYGQCQMELAAPKEGDVIKIPEVPLPRPSIWSEDDPFLYRLLVELKDAAGNTLLERSETCFALIEGREVFNVGVPVYEEEASDEPVYEIPEEERVFRINGEAFFVSGSASYENLLGNDYAWEHEQVKAFVAMYASTGFNAFRDAHVPHHRLMYEEWDQRGMLCWTQMESHLYHDNDAFRQNMRTAVREWVRERRAHPSIFSWGLQNECILPEDFARELCEIIREEDPTASVQRLITTCNGGVGADWNVPQEWSGTYGGNCNDFDLEVAQLVGEYGCWRVPGRHQDCDYCGDENDFTESWAAYALGVKVSRALEVAQKSMGFFHWPFHSFPNPGRSIERKEGEGNDAIAPINSKGLLTSWLQPTDAYYMYQSACLNPEQKPMVYVVSHSWPGRWQEPGVKERLLVYSNCEEVELFNDMGGVSLGVRRNPGAGKPFRWDQVDIRSGTLYAEARHGDKVVATDLIQLPALPRGEKFEAFMQTQRDAWEAQGEVCALVNCGADSDYTDEVGRCWQADKLWSAGADFGFLSWGHDFEHESVDLASRGNVYDPLKATQRQGLYQQFRYGRERLRYHFTLKPGKYRISLGFVEPWYGIGSPYMDCKGWRLFDIAINGQTVVEKHDIWASVGTLQADTLSVEHEHAGDVLEIHFPKVHSAQALVSWIAIESC